VSLVHTPPILFGSYYSEAVQWFGLSIATYCTMSPFLSFAARMLGIGSQITASPRAYLWLSAEWLRVTLSPLRPTPK